MHLAARTSVESRKEENKAAAAAAAVAAAVGGCRPDNGRVPVRVVQQMSRTVLLHF